MGNIGKTIGIISIKGGVGKTSAVSALGAALANDFDKRVLLIDGNFSVPNLALHFGIINPEKTLHHVLHDKIHAAEAIYPTDYGFDIIPGSLLSTKVDPLKLKHKIQPLKRVYDIILLDSSPSLNQELLATMLASDELLVVTTPDIPTLSTTLRAIKIAKHRGTPITGLILNRVRNKKFELSLQQIEDTTDTKVLAVLPDETEILEALAKTIPSTLHKPKANSTIEYKKLAAALIGQEYVNKGLGAKLKSLFSGKIEQQDVNRTILAKNR